jgi:hypothetical protein
MFLVDSTIRKLIRVLCTELNCRTLRYYKVLKRYIAGDDFVYFSFYKQNWFHLLILSCVMLCTTSYPVYCSNSTTTTHTDCGVMRLQRLRNWVRAW